ncbi:MAG: ATP phosphoribosyltransferase [Candidatus Margulisbacteria bacterium]|nr:ATP phosphoribosyltransferase [Candidatus Margulisiibacteriota bacterium]
MERSITIGLPKGYLFKDSLAFFQKQGIEVGEIPDRALIFYDKTKKFKFLILRPTDVPVYVQNGVVDMGVCGMDIVRETKPDLIVLKDLEFGYCRLSVATDINKKDKNFSNGNKVATKFVNSTKEFFDKKGIKVDIIKLYGSVELAAITGLSDYIVDLIATGKTLKENGLVETQTIYETTAHLLVNRVFYSLRNEIVKQYIG